MSTIETNLDPLDSASDSIDLSFPIVPAGIYPLAIAEAVVKPNKRNDGNNLVIKWKSTTELTSTKGDICPPGQIVVMQYIGCSVVEKRTAKQIAQDITRLIRGGRLPGETKPSEVIANPTLLAGKVMPVKIAIQQDTDEFPESNKVKQVVVEG